MAKKKLKDLEFVYMRDADEELTPYRINKNTTIPQEDYESWKDETDNMTSKELLDAKNYFSVKVFKLQKVLDLITAEKNMRERAGRFKMPTSRKSGQLAILRSTQSMARKRKAQMRVGLREHYRPN